MLRVLSAQFKQLFRVGSVQHALQKNTKILHPKVLVGIYDISHVRRYAIKSRLTPFLEEDTMSFKIQEHLGTNSIDVSLADRFGTYSCVNVIHQVLLVVIHSQATKTDDILKLFSLYSTHSFLQDLISKKPLMAIVKKKVKENIPNMTQSELRTFAMTLKKLQFQKIKFLTDVAADICRECKDRAAEADLQHSLELFDILFLMYRNNVYKRKEYDIFLMLFEAEIALAQPKHLVKILHYLGLGKKRRLSKDFVDLLVRKLDTHFQDLSFEDAGIAIAGIFKCNVKLDKSSSVIQKTAQYLKTKVELCSYFNDLESYCLVAMLKIIRAAKFKDEKLLSSINTFIMRTNLEDLSPQFIAHTLALYANSCVYHPKIFAMLENIMILHLRAPSPTVRIRDLGRVLWCFSHVSHKCSTDFFKAVDKTLKDFVQSGEADLQPHFLSDSLLSMAILEHYPQELIKEAFKPEKIHHLQGYQKSKQMSRLLMLNECISIEVPELTVAVPNTSLSNLPTRTLTDEIHHRPALAELMDGVKYINQELDVPVLKLKFPVPYINYASIVFDSSVLTDEYCTRQFDSTSKQSHILQQFLALMNLNAAHIALELMDSHVTLYETSQPIGIVTMKMRLMKQCGWEIGRIHSEDIDSCQNDVQAVAALILEKLTKTSS